VTLVSVSVGLPREVDWHGRSVRTWKRPMAGRVRVTAFKLDGHQQSDPAVHQAVYGYPVEHYAYWGRELPGMDLPPWAFGENFTAEGLLEPDVRVGDW